MAHCKKLGMRVSVFVTSLFKCCMCGVNVFAGSFHLEEILLPANISLTVEIKNIAFLEYSACVNINATQIQYKTTASEH